MTVVVQSHSVLWSASLHSTAGNIQLGYALTKLTGGYAVATTSNLAASVSGRIHGIPLSTGSYPGSVQYQQDGIVDPAFLPFVGPGNETDFANVDALGRVVRSATRSSTLTIGICGKDGSVQFSRSAGQEPESDHINAGDYGAVADNGITDNYGPMTAAIAAAFAASKPLRVRGGNDLYGLSRPIQIAQNPFTIECVDAIRAQFSTSYNGSFFVGPTCLVSSESLVVESRAASSPFSGLALETHGNGFQGVYLSLAGVEGALVNGWGQIRIDAAWTADDDGIYYTLVASGGQLWTSETPDIAYAISVDDTNRLIGILTVGGVRHTLGSSPGAVAARSNAYQAQLSYDGTTIRLFLDGALIASQAASGTITQQRWEWPTIGTTVIEPGEGAVGAYCPEGSIEFIRVCGSGGNTGAYTALSAKPAWADISTTTLLVTFDDGLFDGGLVRAKSRIHYTLPGNLVTGGEQADTWLVYTNYMPAPLIGNVTINGIWFISPRGVGLRCERTQDMHTFNVATTGRVQWMNHNNCYTCVHESPYCLSTGSIQYDMASFVLSSACNDVHVKAIEAAVGGMGVIVNGSSGQVKFEGGGFLHGVDMLCAVYISGGGGFTTAILDNVQLDDEEAPIPGATQPLYMVAINDAMQVQVVNSGNSAGFHNGPCISVCGQNPVVSFIGGIIASSAALGNTHVLEFIGDTLPTSPITFYGVRFVSSGVPLTTRLDAPVIVFEREMTGLSTSAISGDTYVAREPWLDGVLTFTGTLAADANMICPNAVITSRRIANNCTGGDLVCTAIGSPKAVVIAPGDRATVSCDGIDLFLEAGTATSTTLTPSMPALASLVAQWEGDYLMVAPTGAGTTITRWIDAIGPYTLDNSTNGEGSPTQDFSLGAGAAAFDNASAANDYLSAGDVTALRFTSGDFSIHFVFRMDTATLYACPISKGDGSSGWEVYIQGGTIQFGENFAVHNSSASVSTGTVYAASITYNATTDVLSFYLSGSAAGTATSVASPGGLSTTPLRIGARGDANAFFDGVVAAAAFQIAIATGTEITDFHTWAQTTYGAV